MYVRTRARMRGFWSLGNRFGRYGRFGTCGAQLPNVVAHVGRESRQSATREETSEHQPAATWANVGRLRQCQAGGESVLPFADGGGPIAG